MKAIYLALLLCFVSIALAAPVTYDTTSDPSNLNFLGVAHSDSTSNSFVLTESENWKVGGLWLKNPVRLSAGFKVTFVFKITHEPTATTPSGCRTYGAGVNADGLVFLISGNTSTTTGGAAEDLGYNTLNNLAIEFDTYQNSAKNDPASFHIGVQSCGKNKNSADHGGACAVAPPVAITSCYDNVYHTVVIQYDAPTKVLSVSYDGTTYQTVTFNIAQQLTMANNGDSAYVGFTASTGGSRSRHEVQSFTIEDLNQFQCPPNQLINYVDGSCTPCPAGTTANVTFNKCDAPTPTAAAGSCPYPATVAVGGKTFSVSCRTDRLGGDLSAIDGISFNDCLQACATSTQGCVGVTYMFTSCYLKSTLVAPKFNAIVTTAVIGVVNKWENISCPASNNTVFSLTVTGTVFNYKITCDTDHYGGDLGDVVPWISFDDCVARCQATSGCLAAVYDDSCYLKSTLNAGYYKKGLHSAVFIGSTAATAAPPTSSVLPVCPASPDGATYTPPAYPTKTFKTYCSKNYVTPGAGDQVIGNGITLSACFNLVSSSNAKPQNGGAPLGGATWVGTTSSSGTNLGNCYGKISGGTLSPGNGNNLAFVLQ